MLVYNQLIIILQYKKLAQSINNKNDKSTINVFHEVEIQNHTFSYDLNNVLLTGSTGF